MFFFLHVSRNRAFFIFTFCCAPFLAPDIQYDEDEDEITPDLWQEACWIVIRSFFIRLLAYAYAYAFSHQQFKVLGDIDILFYCSATWKSAVANRLGCCLFLQFIL